MQNRTADLYRRFAELEAHGVSATYFEWASAIAEDAALLDLISALPPPKQQPNLLFAVARFLGAPVGSYALFRAWLLEHWDAVEPALMERTTQTNEAGRCAALLPVLSRLTGPLALIEAGASAGLCLYPDRYSYRYDVDGEPVVLDPVDGPSAVSLPCRIDRASVPSRLPDVVWRAGVDLNPIDLRDPGSRAWLETLVWPEHEARRQRLSLAAAIAASDPPHLVRGDLIDEIPALVDSAPAGARVVVFHSSVLVYLDPDRRGDFSELMRSMPEVSWISNEGRGVLPRVEQRLNQPPAGHLVLAVAEEPVALVGPHGQSYQAL